MGDDFKSEFTKSKVYKIQINILYNTKDTDDTNSDDLNNTYYSIKNMQDILIEEFKNKKNYDDFNTKYPPDKQARLNIVNDSFYIDRNVMESLRKVANAGFPKIDRNANNETIRQEKFKTYFDKFIKPDRNIENIADHKRCLLKVFKKLAIQALSSSKYKSAPSYDTEKQNIMSIKQFDRLLNIESFVHLTGSVTFNWLIEQEYDKTSNSDPLKRALNLFYNIYNKLSNKSKYEYFLDPNTVDYIFKIIDDNTTTSSTSNEDYMYGPRKTSLNDSRTKEEIYNKYYKYVFPNKKDISNLNDSEKDKILLFYNVYYIIKNIYLLDDTIISVTNYKINTAQQKKKYYIKHVGLRELDDKNNVTHFQIKDNEVIIFIKATLEYIVENPILQINYLIDDLENARQNFLPQSYILEPKDISNNYSNYNKIYIHDKMNYKNISSDIDYYAKVLRKKNIIKNKEEVFLNTQALKLFNNYFKAQLAKNNITDEMMESNIKFLLYVIFKFYNNKVFKKYYIADTYIQYLNVSNVSNKYYSITNKSIISETSEKYNTISTIFKDSSDGESRGDIKPIYAKFNSPDARLENNKIYKINVVFRCFLDKNGKKPTLGRKLIADNCLSKAQKLDEAFTNTLYRAFRLPENYLYNKLANITHKQNPNITSEKSAITIKGGKNNTRKYKNNVNIILTNNNQ